MSYMPPSWPDQTLCKEHRRGAIQREQQGWMAQRRAALEGTQPVAPQPCAVRSFSRAPVYFV